ncbi:MAG: hypothetical protein GX597_09015 [Anaerolineaceae bacterium]|nr:hypothetical protein [Anaerolineaceae bacterium]
MGHNDNHGGSPFRAAWQALVLPAGLGLLGALALLAWWPGAARADEPAPARVLPETLSAGIYHTCGLRADGSVACWGNNVNGQAPASVGEPGDYVQVSAGGYHTCGLRGDGSVGCWGNNDDDQAPASVGDAGDYVQVSAGLYHTCGVRPDGRVACWGNNDDGQASPPAHAAGDYLQVSAGGYHTCGLKSDGSVACWGRSDYSQAPAAVGAGGDYVQVSAGGYHTCGLRADGRLACWGRNDYSQAPAVEGAAGDYVQVSTGMGHTCAVRADGSVACWGYNVYGQAWPPAHAAGDYLQVSAGGYHTCGLKSDGSVACWGRNNDGQAPASVGDPGDYGRSQLSSGGYHTCGSGADGSVACWGRNNDGQAPAVEGAAGDYGRSQLSSGVFYTCGTRADGSVACWGNNDDGQAPAVEGAAGDYVQVSAGTWHTCAVRPDGSVACWGRNDNGQAPASEGGAGDFVQVSAGTWHTCGLRPDGRVACWGNDLYGQASPPAHVAGDYLQVSAGNSHTCGLKSDGSVACWGYNNNGQAPASVGAAGDYVQVSAGNSHTCGVRPDGRVDCWGRNDEGQAPASVDAAGDSLQVGAGGFHTCGLKTDGGVACWGQNTYGQAPRLSLAPATLPCAPAGEAYYQALPPAGGGTAPYTYTAIAGTPPPGLALSAGGVLTGTPAAAGFYTWTVRASDSSPLPFSVEEVYSLTVGGPLVHADPAGACGGGEPCFVALQEAAACAQFGGIVDAHGATYGEDLTVTRALTLTGAPILNGSLVVGDGLVGYWPLDEGSGPAAGDASGRGHDGTLTNGPAWTATAAPLAFGSPHALALDGTDDVVLVAGAPDLGFDDNLAFSLAAWVRTDRTTAQEDGAAIVARGTDGGEQYVIDILGGQFRFFVRDGAGGGGYDVRATDVWTATAGWTHVAAVFDAGRELMALYVNGVEQDRRLPPASLLANSDEVSIGSRKGQGGSYDGSFQGQIDDVRIYDRALPAPEIAALAAGGHNNTLVLGAGLDLNGDLTLNAALLDAGAGGQALNLSGDWTSHGGAFAARASTVRFDGAQVQTIAGDVAFYDLAVGVGVSLTTASEVSAGGTLTNLGWTVESKAIGGAGERAFGLAGVTVDVVTPGSLSALVVARRDQDHPQAHPTTATGRYWRITPTGSGYTAGLTLPHAGLADPYASRYLGSNWDWGRDTYDAGSVTRGGITAFSEWAVSEGAPAVATPVLLGPADGTSMTTTSLTLTWQASLHATGYYLNLDGTVHDVGNTTQYATGPLAGGVHTWTVAAYNVPANVSPYAATWSFTVQPRFWTYLPLLVRNQP